MKDLASHIMDIVQNSVRAGARTIGIQLRENHANDDFVITVEDNGSGMDASTLAQVRNPFFTSRTVRKVGLGIPLLQQNAERTGGQVSISSSPGKGTVITARFSHSHLDRPPLGDIADTLLLLFIANPDIHFIYDHLTDYGHYIFDTEEIRRILEGMRPGHPEISSALKQLIQENLKDIKADH